MSIIAYLWVLAVCTVLGFNMYAVRKNHEKLANWLLLGLGIGVALSSVVQYAVVLQAGG